MRFTRHVQRIGEGSNVVPGLPADVLRATAQEALIVAVAASTLATGEPLSEIDLDRVLLASRRLAAAVQEAGYA